MSLEDRVRHRLTDMRTEHETEDIMSMIRACELLVDLRELLLNGAWQTDVCGRTTWTISLRHKMALETTLGRIDYALQRVIESRR